MSEITAKCHRDVVKKKKKKTKSALFYFLSISFFSHLTHSMQQNFIIQIIMIPVFIIIPFDYLQAQSATMPFRYGCFHAGPPKFTSTFCRHGLSMLVLLPVSSCVGKNILFLKKPCAKSWRELWKTDFFAEGFFAVLTLISYSQAIKILITPSNWAQKVVSVHQFSQSYLKLSQSWHAFKKLTYKIFGKSGMSGKPM